MRLNVGKSCCPVQIAFQFQVLDVQVLSNPKSDPIDFQSLYLASSWGTKKKSHPPKLKIPYPTKTFTSCLPNHPTLSH